jgi:hypothetical protein
MEDRSLSLESALLDRLQMTIKTKQGGVALDENGNPLNALQAIAMSILQNAMRGDIQSATFIRNISRSAENVEERMRVQEARLQTVFEKIKGEFDAEGLYLGQDVEIEQLAHNVLLIESLNRQMQSPDYEDMIQEFRRDGSTSVRVNPLHELRDKYQKAFFQDLKDLRADAVRRKVNIRNSKGFKG